MAVPTYTEQQYITLKNAIAQGTKRVKYADKEVEYQSLEAMRNLLEEMAVELGYKKPGGGRHYAEFSKGLC
jgi:hypothetical protein